MTGPLQRDKELHTWPQIAAYLDISVREAQYRAKSEGMPVRRGAGKKPRVWALQSELDAWKLRASKVETSATVAPPFPVEERNTPMRKWNRRALLGAAGLAAAGMGVKLFLRSREPRVERAVFTGNLLTALNGLDKPIWTHRFAGTFEEPVADDSAWRTQIVDLEGTGNPGVLAVRRRRAEPSQLHEGIDELSYFTPAGNLKWVLPCRPDLLDFDGKQFEPVWWCSHVIPVPAGKGQALWVGVNHGWRWPGCVLRVDAKGAATLQFANSGYVERLCRLMRPNGEFIAIGGENNAFDRACAAVLGSGDPASCSPPGGAPRCHFANPPSGAPRDYLLFPTTEMLTAAEIPYGRGRALTQTNDGGFILTVGAGDSPSAGLLYQFSGATKPDNVMPSGGCPSTHRRLETQGRLNHAWATCPEIHAPLTIRHWSPTSGWRDEKVPWRAATDFR